MVFFTCNACNESLKKNQVEKHYTQRCRRCEFLSCVDCGKEFWGDSYQSHTKCISEAEKYSGKDYVAKPNKGEMKQELWTQKVMSALQKAPSNPQLKNLLTRLEEYPNIPRKKPKFENFLKCSLRVFNTGLMNQVWDLLMAEKEQANGNSNLDENKSDSIKGETDGNNIEVTEPETISEQKLSKRDRKEQRKKKAHKAEKKDKGNLDDGMEAGKREKKKKKGKRKIEEEEDEKEEENQAEAEIPPKKKRRKVENGTAVEDSMVAEPNTHNENDTLSGEKTRKFDWGSTIVAVLKSKGEISIKKLRKKVLAEYASYGSNKPAEKVYAKFDKKLSKMPSVKVFKDRAKLVHS